MSNEIEKEVDMMGKGTIKSNDFARGAASKGAVTRDQKLSAREALLAKARAKAKAASENK